LSLIKGQDFVDYLSKTWHVIDIKY